MHKVSVRRTERKICLNVENIKIDFKQIQCYSVDLDYSIQDMEQCWSCWVA